MGWGVGWGWLLAPAHLLADVRVHAAQLPVLLREPLGGGVQLLDVRLELRGVGPRDELAARGAARRLGARVGGELLELEREVEEEAGLRIDGASLIPFSHWTTPENQPKRFAAWFFIGTVPSADVVTVDGSEIVDHQWVTVGEALEQRFRNDIALAPPAFVSLLRIREFRDAADILAYVAESGVERFSPRVVELDGGRCSVYSEDVAYDSLDLTVSGPRHRLRMLKNGWQYINRH